MDELSVIEIAKSIFGSWGAGVRLGIGDDCAIIKAPRKGYEQAITTDTLVENIHFKTEWTTPYKLGYKTAAVNLSDLASMGAGPKFLLLSLTLTKVCNRAWIKNYLNGFNDAIKPYRAKVIGGNVSNGKELSFTVTAIGEIKEGEAIARSGAKKGDLIYVTGFIGDSVLGLDALEERGSKASRSSTMKPLIDRHLEPTPRIKWGELLAKKRVASAMIDISDGVVLDLSRLLDASGRLSAKLFVDNLLLSASAKEIVEKGGVASLRRILTGGEDYELLFTVHPKDEPKLERLISQQKIVATKIGNVGGKPSSKQQKIVVFDSAGSIISLPGKGWIHT